MFGFLFWLGEVARARLPRMILVSDGSDVASSQRCSATNKFAQNTLLEAGVAVYARADYSYFVGTKYSYPMARLSLLRNQCLPKSKLLSSIDYLKLSALAANKIDKGIKQKRKGEDL